MPFETFLFGALLVFNAVPFNVVVILDASRLEVSMALDKLVFDVSLVTVLVLNASVILDALSFGVSVLSNEPRVSLSLRASADLTSVSRSNCFEPATTDMLFVSAAFSLTGLDMNSKSGGKKEEWTDEESSSVFFAVSKAAGWTGFFVTVVGAV